MSEVTDIPEEILDEVVDTTYELGRQAGQNLVRVGIVAALGGLVVGSVASYFLTRRQLESKYNEISENEIAEMRQHYKDKAMALENTVAKPELEALVREQGYSSEPPMAVTPPTAVVDAAKEAEESIDPRPEPEVAEENVFDKPPVTAEERGLPIVDREWDYEKEKRRRSPIKPYIIHVDEKEDHDSYDMVTFTYYEQDDVLCNERDEVVGKDERDALVGEANLERFGHGSGDASIVYIRNDRLEMSMEVVLSPNSFAEEVHGFRHSEQRLIRGRRRERRSPDDE